MNERSSVKDFNVVGMGINNRDESWVVGEFEVWITGPDGLPLRVMKERDGSLHYRVKARNSLTDEMKNLLRSVVFRKSVSGAGGPAGGLWTNDPYIGLMTTNATAASTSASLSPGVECSGGGYGRKNTMGWTNGGTGNCATTAAIGWTAGTDLTAGTTVAGFIVTPGQTTAATQPNNYLISFAALNGGSQTVASGNTLNLTYSWTVS